MAKCRILSGDYKEITDINKIVTNLYSSYQYADGIETDEDFRSLSLQIKEKLLNDYIHKAFKKVYDYTDVDAATNLQEYISSVFLDPDDEYSALVIPSIEEIQQALQQDGGEFKTGTTSDKDEDTTKRIELDNEGKIIRKHLSDKFMTKALGNAYETRKYVENFGILGILSSAIIDRRKGNKITDINKNLRDFQEELFRNIVEYAQFMGVQPAVTTLYTKDGPTKGLVNLRGFISQFLTTEIFDSSTLNRIYSQIQSGKASKGNQLAFNAYISLVLLNNFDAFISHYFNGNIEINERYNGVRTLESKYRLASKGTNMNQTWRTSSEIFVVDEIDGLTKQLINTTPRYGYNGNTPIGNTFLTYPQFLTQICKIKELMHSFAPDFKIDVTAINSEGQPIWKLSKDTKEFVRGKSFKEIIALTSSTQAEEAWIAIFEIMGNTKNPRPELFSQFSQDDISIIQSIYRGIFNKESKTSIAGIMKNYPDINRNYLEYIIQNATSVFPVKFIQYLKDSSGVYARNIQDQAQTRAKRNIETAINTQNSKAKIQLEGEYNPSIYAIQVSENEKNLTLDPLAKDPLLAGQYKCTLSLAGKQDIIIKPHQFTEQDYRNLKNFFSEILSLNLYDARFEQALFAQYLGTGGVNFNNLTSDLYDMCMRVLANQWISNVYLKNATTKSNIYAKLIGRSGFFTKETMPRFNESLEEISLFNTSVDYPKLEKLAAAWTMSRLNSSFIQVQDGEGNTSSTSTLSNLQSNYRVQWLEQIKHNEDAPAKRFSILNDGFVSLFRQKELHNQDSSETKQATDFNFAEFISSSLIQNFIDGLIDYNKLGKRISDNIYPIKNGKVGILPSVNADKSFIGLLATNLNQIMGTGEITWREALKLSAEDFKTTLFENIIQPELGYFFKKAEEYATNTLKQALKLANVPQNIIDKTSILDFRALNTWAATYGVNLPKLLFDTTNKYNNTPEGRIKPIELIDQVHYIATDDDKLAINPSFAYQLAVNNTILAFDEFISLKESQLLKDLIKNKVVIYTDSLSQEQYKQYKELASDTWEQNGQLILAKFTDRSGKVYNVLGQRDLRLLQKQLNPGKTNIIKHPDQLSDYGTIEMNPLLVKFNLLDYAVTTEWNYSTVGAFYAHPSKAKIKKIDHIGSDNITIADFEWDSASRTDASFKRNVANTASEHIFLLNTLDGIPDTYNVAVIDDLVDTVYNITGDIDTVSPTDGGMFVNPFVVHLENNSLKGERVGINKKQFCHAYSAETGTQIIIKTAGFGLTNETMRMSQFDQALMHKMTQRNWLSKTGKPLDINILQNVTYSNPNSIDQGYYFKRDGKYYKLLLNDSRKATGGANTYVYYIQEVSKNGTPLSKPDRKATTIQSNYDLWMFFGGKDSMNLTENGLEWSEASIEAVVNAMNHIAIDDNGKQIAIYKGCFQPLKHSDIHYACGAGAVKCGAANTNARSAFDVDDENFNIDTPLNFMKVKATQLGIQLDKEHQATGEELSLMTQVISACIARGYTLDQALEMYKGLAQLSKQETSNFAKVQTTNQLEQVVVATILGQASKSSLNNSTLENLIAPLLEKKERGETITLQDIKDAGIPYSDNAVYNKIISMCAVELTRKGIKAKVDGLLAVLCPSHNRIKIYGDRLLSSWDNEDSLPKKEDGTPLTILDEQRNPKYLIYDGKSTDNIVNIQMGRTYQLRLEDGSSDLYQVVVPKDYHRLKDKIRKGEVTGVFEFISNGRNLGEYNARFYDKNGHRWQLYDLKSTMDLFDIKQLAKLTAKDVANIESATISEIDLDKINEKLGGTQYTQDELRALIYNGALILNTYYNTTYNIDSLSNPEILNLFKRKDLPVLIRRQLQKDLTAIHAGGNVRLYNGSTVAIDKSRRIEEQAAELVMPKKFAEEFGLKKNDDLSTISRDPDFFTNRIIENLTLNSAMISRPENWDIAFKNISGKHVYVLQRDNLTKTSGLSLKDNVHTITDSSGTVIRVDSSYAEMYSMASDQDVIYQDEYGNEVIVTDDIHYYMDNLQYTNIEISKNTANNAGVNYDSQFKDLIDYMSDSSNDVAKELYDYYVIPETQDPITKEIIPGTDLATEPIEELLATNTNINSPRTIKESKMFRHIQKQGREIHTSFLRSLDIIAARIPAQSMQSFMAMKIVAFVESDVNTAYVSTDQIWLQGSDYIPLNPMKVSIYPRVCL